MNFYSAGERAAFSRLKSWWRSRYADSDSFDLLANSVAEMVALRLLQRWHAAGWQRDSAERILRERYGFSSPVLETILHRIESHLQQADSQDVQSVPRFPDLPDIAAPFLDVFAPKAPRRSMGFYLTPLPVIRQLLEQLHLNKAESIPSLADDGAGCGSLALLALQTVMKGWSHERNERAQRLETLLQSWRICELHPVLAGIIDLQLLWLLHDELRNSDREHCHWPVLCGDALQEFPQRQFSHLIGNPPYIGEKQARERIANALSNAPELAQAYTGKADYLFLFLFRAVQRLQPGGRLAFLTPAYWPGADGAASLRRALIGLADLQALLQPVVPVPSAAGVDTCVVVFQKPSDDENAIAGNTNTSVTISRANEQFSVSVSRKRLQDAPWRFIERPHEQRWLDEMERSGKKLGGVTGAFDIFTGVQSGLDKITRAHLQKGSGLKEGQGVFVLSNEEADALLQRASELERALVFPLFKSPAIGPFLMDRHHSGFLIYLDGSQPIEELATLHQHLLPFKSLLEQRRESRNGRMPWWRLHWPRKIENLLAPSLLVPQRAAWPRFALAPEGAMSSVDVYHLLPNESERERLSAWLTILHSSPVHLWLRRRGKRKGDLLELYHTPLSNLPIPTLAEQDWQHLNDFGRRSLQFCKDLQAKTTLTVPWYRIWQQERLTFAGMSTWMQEWQQVEIVIASGYGLTPSELAAIRKALPQLPDVVGEGN